MTLGEDVDLEEFITAKDDLSGADIKAVCTEAGLLALRERRMRVTKSDFSAAREKVKYPRFPPTLRAHVSPRYYTGRMRASRRAYICNFLLLFHNMSASPCCGGLKIFPDLTEAGGITTILESGTRWEVEPVFSHRSPTPKPRLAWPGRIVRP